MSDTLIWIVRYFSVDKIDVFQLGSECAFLAWIYSSYRAIWLIKSYEMDKCLIKYFIVVVIVKCGLIQNQNQNQNQKSFIQRMYREYIDNMITHVHAK